MLTVIVQNKLRGFGIGLKVKLLGDKAKGHVWLVTREGLANDVKQR